MKFREIFRKYKIKAKKIYTVIALTIIEMVMILWCNNWVPTPMIMIPLVQFIAIFENREGWSKLSEEEKKKLTLTEDELDNFVNAISEKLAYMTVEDILLEIKK